MWDVWKGEAIWQKGIDGKWILWDGVPLIGNGRGASEYKNL
jgi:hypothetical protein